MCWDADSDASDASEVQKPTCTFAVVDAQVLKSASVALLFPLRSLQLEISWKFDLPKRSLSLFTLLILSSSWMIGSLFFWLVVSLHKRTTPIIPQ